MRLTKFATVAGCILAICLDRAAFAKGGHGGGHSSSSTGYHAVSGYTTKNGTYVAPHYQTNPNGTKNDNWSTVGNVNPFTGKEGTKPRDGSHATPLTGVTLPKLDETYPASAPH